MLTHEQVDAVLAAALEHASAIGSPSSVAVVDAGRELLAFRRQDGTLLAGIELSIAKARTARSLNMTTADLGAAVQPGAPLYGLPSTQEFGFIPFGGGRPLTVDGQVVGAVGAAGGSPDQDDEVAAAGAAAIAPGR
jgi:uncharacterized protein GlcG (DUF336 family)